jgi:hypothetical protein
LPFGIACPGSARQKGRILVAGKSEERNRCEKHRRFLRTFLAKQPPAEKEEFVCYCRKLYPDAKSQELACLRFIDEFGLDGLVMAISGPPGLDESILKFAKVLRKFRQEVKLAELTATWSKELVAAWTAAEAIFPKDLHNPEAFGRLCKWLSSTHDNVMKFLLEAIRQSGLELSPECEACAFILEIGALLLELRAKGPPSLPNLGTPVEFLKRSRESPKLLNEVLGEFSPADIKLIVDASNKRFPLVESSDEKLSYTLVTFAKWQTIVKMLAKDDINKAENKAKFISAFGRDALPNKCAWLPTTIKNALENTTNCLLYTLALQNIAPLGSAWKVCGPDMISNLAMMFCRLSTYLGQARSTVALVHGDFLSATNGPVSYKDWSGVTWHDVATQIAERLLISIWQLHPGLFVNTLHPACGGLLTDPKPIETKWDTVCEALTKLSPFSPADCQHIIQNLEAEAGRAAKGIPDESPKSLGSVGDAENPPGTSADGTPEVKPVVASKLVALFGPGEKPKVKGKYKDTLTAKRYNVVQALIQAGKDGLTKDELDRQSGHTEARKAISDMVKNDRDWKAVIIMPQKTGKRYRIR